MKNLVSKYNLRKEVGCFGKLICEEFGNLVSLYVKNLVSKYNIGKAQIIKKKAVGGMTKKFCTTLHMPSVTYLRNRISYIQLELSL